MAKVFTRIVLRSIIVAVLFALVSVFELPLYIDLLAGIILIPASCLLPWTELLLSSAALTFSLVFSGVLLLLVYPKEARYYREHDKYVTSEGRYVPNVTDTINSQNGDLAAIDPTVMWKVREPRVIHFHTDSFGYRNDHDYDHQRIILNGDSFVVGNGLSQELTLSAVLKRKYSIPSYSIAFPSDPIDYEDRAHKFLERFPDESVSFVHFFYEGNDFDIVEKGHGSISSSEAILDPQISQLLSLYQMAKAKFWGGVESLREVGRIGASIFSRLERGLFLREATEVDIMKIGSAIVAFHKPQGAVSIAETLKVRGERFLYPEVWMRTPCLFIIPTKDRVYRKYLGKYREFSSPSDSGTSDSSGLNSRVQAVQQWLDTLSIATKPKVIDLAPFFEKKADELILKNKYLYWRDDTHLNAHGAELLADLAFQLCPQLSR